MSNKDDIELSFLTWNIYFGFDPTPLAGGFNPVAVTQVFRQFLATNFPVRAKALARAIASKKPAFIGLQEVELITLTIPTFGTVTYDFIEILLEELENRGLHYKVAAKNKNRDLQGIPDSNGNTIGIIDFDVILIQKDHDFRIINKQEENFTATFMGIPRGWSAIDVKLDGQVFRMINTHLEPLNQGVREAQALELINGPANTNLPVIITGDLNSTPNSDVIQFFIMAGFHDAWSEVGEGNGFTCCQGADLLNAVSTLNFRIDYILFKNGWDPIKAELVGESQNDRTNTGLWPSDHAGVWAKLELDDHHHHHHHEESCD
ncbi:endonuclease/exonuclease/phosphatase family protein [Bacillus sp. 1P10SD]|uniref:endonuclease/exonuclease/phosphatase family protein n=1 Tax=Bacillus sp. 1P10SD TaxID=3132265 RepID=UPI0039A5C29C